MGRGWLAEDELLRRLVALKQDILSGPTCVGSYSAAPDRLLIEACAAATVNQSGAITIYDVVTDDDRNWIVMEPPFGRTLAEVIAAEGPLPVAQVTNIGLGLLDVLQAAHRVGILHCDVKPPNVHLCTTGGWYRLRHRLQPGRRAQQPDANVGRQPRLHSAGAAPWRQTGTGFRPLFRSV